MKRFKNILIVVNDNADIESNPALIRGRAIARENSARITLMDVVAASANSMREYKDIFSSDELTAMMVEQRKKELDLKAEQFKSENIDIDTRVVAGRDFIEIVRQVLVGKHDLIIKVANAYTGSFDSSDFHLMRKSPTPVWLINPSHLDKARRVLASIDLALESSDEGRAMNTLIMDIATAVAQQQGSKLYALSCWSLYGESALRHSGFMKVSEDRLAQILKEEEAANQASLNGLVARYSDLDIDSYVVKEEPKHYIPEFVREHDIDVVVMGSVGRSGVPGLLIGNTAETVLQSIDSSVITLKPSGFESPILP